MELKMFFFGDVSQGLKRVGKKFKKKVEEGLTLTPISIERKLTEDRKSIS